MNDTTLFELLKRSCAPYGVEITPEKFGQFDAYRALLLEWNEKINLTAITDDKEIMVKHFADCLTAAPSVRKIMDSRKGKTSLADVGTGAGFPGIPLKIAFPELKVVLLDSLEKRIAFLDDVIARLGLEGIETVHGRAEDFGRAPQYRDRFDVTTARAVAPMPVLLEYCLPPLRTDGYFLALKGTKDDGSIANALKKLSGKLVRADAFTLDTSVLNPEELPAERKIYVFKKIGPTDKTFPRKAGTPAKNPL